MWTHYSVFGILLTELVDRKHHIVNGFIPEIIVKCIKALDDKGTCVHVETFTDW